MSFKHWLIHTCNIESFAGSALPTGEIQKTWSIKASGTAVPCRYVRQVETYADEQDGLQRAFRDRLFFKAGVNVASQDRIANILLTSTGGTVDAGNFKILATLPRNSAKQRHITLEIEKID